MGFQVGPTIHQLSHQNWKILLFYLGADNFSHIKTKQFKTNYPIIEIEFFLNHMILSVIYKFCHKNQR